MGYSKIVMAGSDQSKSKPAISGLPCCLLIFFLSNIAYRGLKLENKKIWRTSWIEDIVFSYDIHFIISLHVLIWKIYEINHTLEISTFSEPLKYNLVRIKIFVGKCRAMVSSILRIIGISISNCGLDYSDKEHLD